MATIFGKYLKKNKTILFALTVIYGIGVARAKTLLKEYNISENLKVSEISKQEIRYLRSFIEHKYSHLFESNLIRNIKLNISRLIEINSYRGQRHMKGLPTRGQRTRTNSRTSRRLYNKNIII